MSKEMKRKLESDIQYSEISNSLFNNDIKNYTHSSDKMILIEGDIFLMGANSFINNEKPPHFVIMNSYFISNTPVTYNEFSEFIAESDYRTDSEKNGGSFIMSEDFEKLEQRKDANWKNPCIKLEKNCPVVCVSWYDAIAYCNWRSIKEGYDPCYDIINKRVKCNFSKNGYRLPTEAEWEYAARGGKDSQKTKFSGSSSLENVGWYNGNSEYQINSVKGKYKNEAGLYDMSGNVYEWCWNWYEDYSQEMKYAPTGPEHGLERIIRGGSIYSNEYYCRVASRMSETPEKSYAILGFRLACSCKL